MRSHIVGSGKVLLLSGSILFNQPRVFAQAGTQPNPVPALVGRLDLEKYKATIKGLTQFGDRREGTERNRNALDWIETQLRSYGCSTGRVHYDHAPRNPASRAHNTSGRRPPGDSKA